MNGPVSVHSGSFIASSKTMTKTPRMDFDDEDCYCRILGHYLSFSYCRSCQEGAPCFKILDCWFERFLQPPKPKVQTLVALIQQAQKRMKKE
jgi:hypothetical protein